MPYEIFIEKYQRQEEFARRDFITFRQKIEQLERLHEESKQPQQEVMSQEYGSFMVKYKELQEEAEIRKIEMKRLDDFLMRHRRQGLIKDDWTSSCIFANQLK